MKNKVKYILLFLLPILMLGSCQEDFDYKLSGNPPENNGIDVSERLSGFDQEEAEIGSVLTMNGRELSTVKRVMVAGELATDVQASENSVSFVVPNGAPLGEQDFHFIFSGNERAVASITVVPKAVPEIYAITPTAVPVGEKVTILGISFIDVQVVTIGDVEADVDPSSTSEALIVTVPEGLPDNVPATIEIVTARGKTKSESMFYVGKNLIMNGEFELGEGDDFDFWTKANNGELTLAGSSDSYAGRTLRAVSGSDSQQWHPQMFATEAPTQVGSTYTLLLWIKGAVGTPGDGGHIRFSTTPNPQYSPDFDVTSEWRQIIWEFTANSEETQIVLDLGGVGDAVYFIDNVTLLATGEAAPQPIELLLNGGFEEGEGDDFDHWGKYNGEELLLATTKEDEVRNGERALMATGAGGDHWRTQFVSDGMPTIEGRTYIASFWVKPKAGSPAEGGVVRMSTQGNGSPQYQGDQVVSAGDWQKIEWTFTANGTETMLVLDLGFTEDAVYFIDDASFLEIPE